MAELVPHNSPENQTAVRWRPVVQFLGRLVGRGETLEAFEAARIAEVRAETAQVRGAVGRLGRLVDGLLLSPPEGASLSGMPYRMRIKRVVHPVEITYPVLGNTVVINRTTDYNYDPVFGRVPPGNDEITVIVRPTGSTHLSAGKALMPPDSDLREIGMRVRTDVAPNEWLKHGMHQVGDWDGHPGTQYTWQLLDEAAANAFLDRVFGPEQAAPSELC